MRACVAVPDGAAILIVDARDLLTRAVVDVAPTAVHALAADGSAMAYAEGSHVTVVADLLGGSPRIETTFRAPGRVDALAMQDGVVLVAASGAAEAAVAPATHEMRSRVGLFDRASGGYVELGIPEEAAARVRHIALVGERLVVVRGGAHRNHIDAYDVRDLGAARLVERKWLDASHPRSFVTSVADDGVTLAILQDRSDVALVRLADLRFHGSVRNVPRLNSKGWPRDPSGRRDETVSPAAPLDARAVAIAGSTLFLAANESGLAWADLANVLAPRSYAFRGALVEDTSPLELGSEAIRRVRVPEGPVVGVVAVDATRVYAVVERDGERHGVEVHVEP